MTITQYPVVENIPQTLKQQSRRLGLKAEDVKASMVIIDRPGLNLIKAPGRGLLTGRADPQPFRGLLFDRPDENRPNIEDDFETALSAIPQNKDEWPKLPAGVAPSKWLVEKLGLDVEYDDDGQVVPYDHPTVDDYQPVAEAPPPRQRPRTEPNPEPSTNRPPWMQPAFRRRAKPPPPGGPPAEPTAPEWSPSEPDADSGEDWEDVDDFGEPDRDEEPEYFDDEYSDDAPEAGFEDLYRSFRDSRSS